jgi:AraC-like DNA-binding protein
MVSNFASVAVGRESRPSGERVPRHRHARGYAAVVLAGGYEEAGERARMRVGPGDVILHGAFEAHLNRIAAAGAEILNIELPDCIEPCTVFATLLDPDALVRAAELDTAVAAQRLLQMLQPAHRLSPATLSRGFYQVYGVSPSAFRAQIRGRHAWRRIVSGAQWLAGLATELGFADQAHMTRAVRSLTGRPPGAWRTSN